MVPKSANLNDLQPLNESYFALDYRIHVASGAHYVKVVEDTRTLSAAKM